LEAANGQARIPRSHESAIDREPGWVSKRFELGSGIDQFHSFRVSDSALFVNHYF
jgi:hypothetical protein